MFCDGGKQAPGFCAMAAQYLMDHRGDFDQDFMALDGEEQVSVQQYST
jgi:hypothetical protein